VGGLGTGPSAPPKSSIARARAPGLSTRYGFAQIASLLYYIICIIYVYFILPSDLTINIFIYNHFIHLIAMVASK